MSDSEHFYLHIIAQAAQILRYSSAQIGVFFFKNPLPPRSQRLGGVISESFFTTKPE